MTQDDSRGGQPSDSEQGRVEPAHKPSLFPKLGVAEWIVFAILAGYRMVMAGWRYTLLAECIADRIDQGRPRRECRYLLVIEEYRSHQPV